MQFLRVHTRARSDGITPGEKVMSWRPEVQTDFTDKWYGNAVRFATKEEAESWTLDRALRWTAVLDTRVVECTDPVNYRWVNNCLTPLSAEEEKALKAEAPAFAKLLREQGIIQ
jgi:hypothetical protein